MDFKKIEQEKAAIKVYKKDWKKITAELDKLGYKWSTGEIYTEMVFDFCGHDAVYLYIDRGLYGFIEPDEKYYIYETPTLTPEERLWRAIFSDDSEPGCSDTNETEPDYLPVITKFLIDPDNRVCIFYIGGKKFVVKCHPEDRFNWRIAAGVAYSRFNKNNKSLDYLRKTMLEKKYYFYCFKLMYDFDTTAIENAVLKSELDYKEALIQEQIRKAECEIRKQKYVARNIERKFITL